MQKQNFTENKRKFDEFVYGQKLHSVSEADKIPENPIIQKKFKNSDSQSKNNENISQHNLSDCNDSWKINIIERNDKDTYAFTSLQSVFHCPSIRSKFSSNPEKNPSKKASKHMLLVENYY